MHENLKAVTQNDLSITCFIRKKAIMNATGLSTATLWRLMRDNKFPKPMQLGPNSIAWRVMDYESWAKNPQAWVEKNRTNPA